MWGRGGLVWHLRRGPNLSWCAVTMHQEHARQFDVISALALKQRGKSVVGLLAGKLNHDVPLYEKVQTGRKSEQIISFLNVRVILLAVPMNTNNSKVRKNECFLTIFFFSKVETLTNNAAIITCVHSLEETSSLTFCLGKMESTSLLNL